MRIILLAFFCFVALSCSKVRTAPLKNPPPTPASNPAPGKIKELGPVVPHIDLNKTQKKNLDEILPPKVREILEKSGRFDILAEEGEDTSDGDIRNFEPNRIAAITGEKVKKELLEGFYYDVSTEPYPAVCYEPHHGIRAEYNGQKVEIDICFSCSRVVIRSPFGEFSGGMTHKDRRSESIFERIVKENSVELKK